MHTWHSTARAFGGRWAHALVLRIALGVLLMLVGIQVLTTGLIGEMITYKGFRRSDSYSVRELLE